MVRLCTALTVIGGTLLVVGRATGLVGEVTRATSGRGSHPALGVAEILIVSGMLCGAALLATVAGWHVSIQLRHPPRRVARPRVVAATVDTASRAPAQQKIAQLKDLYREAEAMGDEELSAHWEEIRRRQHELIRQYFEQARLASNDLSQDASADAMG